jgi:hypothetical protein
MTMPDDREERAAEHVLGLTSAAARDAMYRAADADPAVADALADWNVRLTPLLGEEAVAPPAGLFDRILAGIGQRSQQLPGTFTVRALEGRWQTIAEGVERKMLWAKGPNDRKTFLLRMRAGAHYVAHHHEDDEECLVLSGDLTFDTLTLREGDYHLARGGASHPSATTVGGCMVLITAAAA